MPITPFHFAPGAAMHAVTPRWVSFIAFCSANVLMDVEPLYYMLTNQYPLHRFFHTYIGATLVMVATALLFKVALASVAYIPWPNVFGWQALTPRTIWLGAAAGSYSHIMLDSVMHPDIQPLWPLSLHNALYQYVSLEALHLFCVIAGALGLLVLIVRRLLSAK